MNRPTDVFPRIRSRRQAGSPAGSYGEGSEMSRSALFRISCIPRSPRICRAWFGAPTRISPPSPKVVHRPATARWTPGTSQAGLSASEPGRSARVPAGSDCIRRSLAARQSDPAARPAERRRRGHGRAGQSRRAVPVYAACVLPDDASTTRLVAGHPHGDRALRKGRETVAPSSSGRGVRRSPP
jgi:hypothetical protein